MAADPPLLRGLFASHPLAAKFALEVLRIHRRYAAEVVAARRLCPHLRDVDKDFGVFVAMLDPGPELDVDAAVDAVVAADHPVVHVVFPLACPPPAAFERFGGRVHRALRKAFVKPGQPPPVMATFHPEMAGDSDDAQRLIGLIRRAPDPFVQMIPDGYQEGGTVFVPLPPVGQAMPVFEPPVEWSQRNFEKLRGAALGRMLDQMADIRADRARSYAPYLEAFGLAPRG